VNVSGYSPYIGSFGGYGQFSPYGGYYNGKYVDFSYNRTPGYGTTFSGTGPYGGSFSGSAYHL